MSEIQNAIRELSTILKEITLPAGFLESYDQLECLSHSHGTETYLVQHKGSKSLCVAKCYDRKMRCAQAVSAPKAVVLFDDQRQEYLVIHHRHTG